MRIVVLANSDVGLYKFRIELVERLCADNEVIAILPMGDYTELIEKTGCKCIPFEFDRRGTNPFDDLKQMRRYKSIMQNVSPDVALTYTIKPNIYGGIACKMIGIPYIANVTGLGTAIENGGILGIITLLLYKLGLRGAACVFFQNKENKRLFEAKRIVKGRARVIPGSGVNLSTHCMEPYPADDGEFRFLFVGRVMKDKGIEELLYAMSELHRRNKKVVLDIVGWCEEDYSLTLRDAEQACTIRYRGKQSNIHPFYKDCHCFVLPSYHEGTANVVLEASATGRPVITTKVPGCLETFDEGETGFGCDARDRESLLMAMEKMISLSNYERAMMGIKAREKMEREYDRNKVIEAYFDEIGRIIPSSTNTALDKKLEKNI